MRNLRLLFALTALPVVSCATTEVYPRCYLFREPEAADIAMVQQESLALLDRAVVTRRYSLGKDVVTVTAGPQSHERLRRSWPANACVNLRHPPPNNGEIGDKVTIALCQDYIAEIISMPAVAPVQVAAKHNKFTCE